MLGIAEAQRSALSADRRSIQPRKTRTWACEHAGDGLQRSRGPGIKSRPGFKSAVVVTTEL